MKAILFFSTELKFFFAKNSNLIVYDEDFLPYSRTFLRNICPQTLRLPPSPTVVFEEHSKQGAILILNERGSVVSLSVYKIRALYGKTVEFFITHNNLARDDIIKLTNSNFLLKKGQ